MKIRNKKLLTKSIAMAIFMSSTLYTMPITQASTALNNNFLPQNPNIINGKVEIKTPDNNTMNINQGSPNAIIKWEDFSIGANATVNFNGQNGFNTLNYVNSGNLSQIYGTINATNGNIYIVNPAGVQIGNSAQINVGSLYVSNNLNNDKLKNTFGETTINNLPKSTVSGGELMSLGNINATDVTFDGNRIVLDVDRVNRNNGQNVAINIKTTNENNVVLGTDTGTISSNITVTGLNNTDRATYTWIKNLNQLQNMSSFGNYALRNNIDASATKDTAFTSIDNFTGKFDGLDYNIFGLHAGNGLFASADGATIRNFSMISGKIGGSGIDNVGAVVGTANNSTIENILNTSKVTGASNVGGIVGSATNDSTLSGLINTGAIEGTSNVGGLAGSLSGSTLKGESYNLGDIKGKDSSSNNIGGLVGSATNSIIGNKTGFQMYNHLDVEGGYNVGGIVGNVNNSTVQNVYNDGNISTTGYITETYKYHTSDKNTDNNDGKSDGFGEKSVQVANVGGIVGNSSGSTIENVQNTGDVKSSKQESNDYYDAGNVGGIVGRAENTNITKALNKESNIYGAHNVGGIAGYFGGSYNTDSNTLHYSINQSQNNGSDIMATGARNSDAFIKEIVRSDGSGGSEEAFIIGNMGGIAGYMSGDNTHIIDSSNRGTVHSLYITDPDNIKDSSKAANTGGIVGKIDRGKTLKLEDINTDENAKNAAVSGSYNTSEVSGYTGIGGVVGMMYNGEVTTSYNVGTVKSTRQSSKGTVEPVNIGGVVGDSTELTNAKAIIYDVYNTGQIGDETYETFGRHVGGVVGRLSGDLIKAYNTGNIYNGFDVNGGVVGYWYKGNIENVFNTGNISIKKIQNHTPTGSWKTGGIVGSYYGYSYGTSYAESDIKHNLTNAYNLGSIRSEGTTGIAGIVGTSSNDTDGSVSKNVHLSINNVYTIGQFYNVNNAITRIMSGATISIENAIYISPSQNGFTPSEALSDLNNNLVNGEIKRIEESNSINKETWGTFIENSGTIENSVTNVWRVYNGTTPILNAFTPNAKDYFGEEDEIDINSGGTIDKIQYGTAYNPLLTIITGKGDEIKVDWSKAKITGMAGLVVNGSALTIDNVSSKDNILYSGTIYTDKALTINSVDGGNISLGSAAKIYGSSIDINVKNGNFNSNGTIVATGANGNNDDNGNITIDANSINNYGVIKTTSNGEKIEVEGISNKMNTDISYSEDDIKNLNKDLPTVGEKYGVTIKNTTDSKTSDDVSDVTITGKDDVNIYYGNLEQGLIDVAGDVNLTGKNVYVDSDMVIDGNLTTTADSTGEIVVDISNIGKVSLDKYTDNLYKELKNNNGKLTKDKINEIITNLESVNKIDSTQLNNFIDYLYTTYVDNSSNKLKNNATESAISDAIIKGRMHNFLKSFSTDTGKYINFAGTDNAKITVDMWDYNENAFNLKKYDQGGNTLSTELDSLYIKTNGDNLPNTQTGKDFVYIWVADGEQLKGIQKYANENTNSKILSYNFALKNDINATDVDKYQSIGDSTNPFTGKFDGRGNRIIGLNTDSSGNSIFATIGADGKVSNLKVYSSNFENGAIAKVNNGIIDNVTGLGNTVTGTGNVGGLVGTNNGTIQNSNDRSTVISQGSAIAGGLVGTNTNNGIIENSTTESAVTSEGASGASMGGIAGTNNGTIKNVDSLGVTSGLYIKTDGTIVSTSNNVGGIVGTNTGTINSAYNESIVTGQDNVGGIAGTNTNTIEDVSNASSVTSDTNSTTKSSEYVGGLVGSNTGSITDGRNNGTITGQDFVAGMVGYNGENSKLSNLVNDDAAEIIGENYIGGIAGFNEGTISADESNLTNKGQITGQTYVGGIAGVNSGTIKNVNNNIILNVKDKKTSAKYFGGIAGINATIQKDTNGNLIKDINGDLLVETDFNKIKAKITNATNKGNITAENATYVGGIAGQNSGELINLNGNYGTVIGGDKVGGVAGINTEDIDGAELVSAGTVKSDGGAGGIFAENSGDITNSDLSNNGAVEGDKNNPDSGTGGLIGINSGDIEKTSLRNEVNGEVSGVYNVGGLIGINSGVIIGEKGEGYHGLNYYKYQIYNNGTIKATGNGSNIGGLIGYNKNDKTTDKIGSLTAGYNTGNIDAGGSTNVGGIVGTNDGTVDQVFNTIAGNGSVKGGTNVGGLIGTNSGTLSNGYSTSSVIGKNNVGNAVGTNEGKINAIYSTLTSGKLISSNSSNEVKYAYTYSEDDDYTITDYLSEEQRESLYSGFDKNIWKGYEGKATPLLKEFLTETKFENGQLVAADNWNAFNNTNGNGSNNLFNQSDIPGSLKYWSYQINTGSGKNSPNNLGYDLPDGLVAYPIKPIDPSEPEKPDREYNWSHIYQDQWDRNRDFKERKAEFNFVDGAIPLDEAVEEV